ncbi:MAG TPA: heterodisulfide reductase-related iron-sulfur binding cluster, partial [Longimicrobiaceae bacterium]|nr:heterodisulfide reductase-related iron-sulfur binding cluster [Longimicrobiaceae bacterium]
GRAAIELLEAAGWEVELVTDVCCGRALISKGLLDEAQALHTRLIEKLATPAAAGVPIAGCEPSCVLTLKDELPALAGGSPEAAAIARQAVLADDLIADAVEDGTLRPSPDSALAGRSILFHGHCHQKAARAVDGSVRLLRSIPDSRVQVLDAGCCGMAGSFGFEREHYDLSMRIGGLRLFPAVEAAPADALIAATGVSCRQQISHGTGRSAQHPIVLLRDALTIE